jgi:hypothetical protein
MTTAYSISSVCTSKRHRRDDGNFDGLVAGFAVLACRSTTASSLIIPKPTW